MRPGQFWVLLACSVIVGLLLLKQGLLTNELYEQERTFGDAEEIAGSANAYDSAWKQLAIRIYETGRNDTEMMGLLKEQGIGIREGKTGDAATAPGAPGQPAPAPAPPLPTNPGH